MNKVIKALLCASLALLSACDGTVKQMGPTEVGLIYRKLPRMLGGGLGSSMAAQNSKVVLMPWDSLLSIDSSLKSVVFTSQDDKEEGNRIIYTRARDGTEVALKVAITYQVMANGQSLQALFEQVGNKEKDIHELVTVVARSEIRTVFSELETSWFADVNRTEAAANKVKEVINKRLSPLGIETMAVSLSGYQFERLRRDGTIDSRYQDALKTIRDLFEKTESTRAAVETVKAQKRAEVEREQANYNQQMQQVQGQREQAVNRANNYYQIKQNEAAAIRAQGEAEVQGLIEQINALAGPGGQALVKLDLVKALLESKPRFVVVPQNSNKGEMQVQRVDHNELLEQLGVFEALKEKDKEKK